MVGLAAVACAAGVILCAQPRDADGTQKRVAHCAPPLVKALVASSMLMCCASARPLTPACMCALGCTRGPTDGAAFCTDCTARTCVCDCAGCGMAPVAVINATVVPPSVDIRWEDYEESSCEDEQEDADYVGLRPHALPPPQTQSTASGSGELPAPVPAQLHLIYLLME